MPVVLDAGPVIYLAKLDALDVFSPFDPGRLPPGVLYEAARPELAYSHPEVVRIDSALAAGRLVEVALEPGERSIASELGGRVSGLHHGELEVLAIGQSRGWEVCLHERQASRLATALGLRSIHVLELIIAATTTNAALITRIREFAAMTNLATRDLDALLDLAHRRHQ